jgi:hypothetical protein
VFGPGVIVHFRQEHGQDTIRSGVEAGIPFAPAPLAFGSPMRSLWLPTFTKMVPAEGIEPTA